jgi:hypothetical protein
MARGAMVRRTPGRAGRRRRAWGRVIDVNVVHVLRTSGDAARRA